MTLLNIEFSKLMHLTSLRFSLALLAIFPIVWAYAPGIFNVYGFYVVSGFQVPGLTLLSSMEFLLPLLVAIACAELVGQEIAHGTLPTILLRPVSRSRWLATKLLVAILYPFLLLLFLFFVALASGIPFGFTAFVGGTGVGAGGILGEGFTMPFAAVLELMRAYTIAAWSLVPVGLLSVFFTVAFMNAASGALATLAVLIFMRLLVVFPGLEPYLLTSQLSAYVIPPENLAAVLTLLMVYAGAFAAASVIVFERKDF